MEETTNPVEEVGTDPADRLAALFTAPPEDDEEVVDEAVEEEQDEDGDDDEVEEGESEPAPEDDSEEVTYGDKQYKLPKELAEVVKKADSLQADYTRKTQDVADTRRIVEDKKQYLEAQELILQHAFSDAAEVQSIQAQLQQFDALDWNSLVAEDAQKALQLNLARQQLHQRLTEKQYRLQQIVKQAQDAKVQHTRNQAELGMAEVQRRIGKLDDKMRETLMTAARQYGMQESHLMDPVVIHALADAAKWRALQSGKPAAVKKAQQARPAAQPAARSTAPSNEQSRWNEQRSALKKTGRQDVAAALLNRIVKG
jgi:hypothetical protein